MSIANRIKEKRESLNMSRAELAEALNITPAAIGNYENGVSTPKETILFKLMEVLQCDANYLFQDDFSIPDNDFIISVSEQQLLEKYRVLDEYGKSSVNDAINKEMKRIEIEQKRTLEKYTLEKEVAFIAYVKEVSVEMRASIEQIITSYEKESEIRKKIAEMKKNKEAGESDIKLTGEIETALEEAIKERKISEEKLNDISSKFEPTRLHILTEINNIEKILGRRSELRNLFNL